MVWVGNDEAFHEAEAVVREDSVHEVESLDLGVFGGFHAKPAVLAPARDGDVRETVDPRAHVSGFFTQIGFGDEVDGHVTEQMVAANGADVVLQECFLGECFVEHAFPGVVEIDASDLREGVSA